MNVNKPTISVAYQDKDLKVLEVSGKSGDQLTSHKVDNAVVLQVLSGGITFMTATDTLELTERNYHLIPKGLVHSVQFNKDSILNLIMTVNTKIKFVRS